VVLVAVLAAVGVQWEEDGVKLSFVGAGLATNLDDAVG